MNTDLREKQKMILKNIFLSWWIIKFLENYRKCEKTERHKTCHNRKRKKLFGVRTKLSYYEVFCRKFIHNKNEKNRDIYKDIAEDIDTRFDTSNY